MALSSLHAARAAVFGSSLMDSRLSTSSSDSRSRAFKVRAALKSGGDSRSFALNRIHAKRAFKVIAGLNNFDPKSVASVVVAAEQGGATHVDIACAPELVKLALGLTSLPVCVSSVEPESFVQAVEAGAHMIEIGNFDSFYESGRVFSASEVLELTRETRKLLPDIVLSVTVPHTLPLDQQVELAEALELEGADIIQTEGGTSSSPSKPGVSGLIEKAVPTLAAAYSISRAVRIPVLCASGLSSVTAPLALAAGASGVGVGSAVNKLNDQVAKIAAVRGIADSIAKHSLKLHQPPVNWSLVFVYGTLKRGFGNHWLMEELITSNHASLVSSATTKQQFPLVCGPYKGELYSVDQFALSRLDELEGVIKSHYERHPVDLIVTELLKSPRVVRAEAYFACSGYAHRLLKAPHLQCYGVKEAAGYVPRRSRPEGMTFLEHVQAWIKEHC